MSDSMKLNSIAGLTYLVKDIEKTCEFYEALGFRIGKQEGSQIRCYVNWFWIDFIADDHAGKPERGEGVSVHIKVDNADEYYEGVMSKGMKPDGTPEGKASTGRSFVLRDPDGYKLVFFEKK